MHLVGGHHQELHHQELHRHPEHYDVSSEEWSSADDQQAIHRKHYSQLPPIQSVYDEALVLPLFGARQWVSWTMLLFNLVMQGVVLVKITELVWTEMQYRDQTLWGGTGGACVWIKPGDALSLHLDHVLVAGKSGSDEGYLYCVPESLLIVDKFESIDLNGDGYWSAQESSAQTAAVEEETGRIMNLDYLMFSLVLKKNPAAQWGDLIAAPATQYNASISRATWESHRNYLQLCQALNPTICPNLEIRGILKKYLPEEHKARKRVAKCENILTYWCPTVIGEKFKQYGIYHADLCGVKETVWHKSVSLRSVRYSTEWKYMNRFDGITTVMYFGFLMVMLIIWWMVMLLEIRLLYAWWTTLWFFPVAENKEDCIETLEEDGENRKFKVLKLPARHRRITMLLNLLPRTILILCISVIGTFFLIEADDYQDLILNCVALTFLIDIDEMIYAGIISNNRKDLCEKTQPLTCEVPKGWSLLLPEQTPWTLVHAISVLVVVISFLLHSYFRAGGKLDRGEALQCLCQGSGRICVSAQIWGGELDVRAAINKLGY